MPSAPSSAVRVTATALALTIMMAMNGCSANTSVSLPSPEEPPSSLQSLLPPSRGPITAPPISAAPGTLIEQESIPAPAGTTAWRVVYHSRSANDADIAVSGIVLVPQRDAPPGGFPIISYGHPTTGAADRCAPSLGQGTNTIPFIDDLIKQGWAIAATDYEGLGGPGPHPYLIGSSEGHSMLDAARAARAIEGAGVTEQSPVVIWGFSQGGHAAAWAAALSPTYAPDLDVRAVAIAAPVSNIDHFARRAERMDTQFGVLATIVHGFAATYPELDPAEVFSPATLSNLDVVERDCIGEVNSHFISLRPNGLRQSPSDRFDFGRRFAENDAGLTAIDEPVLLLQGDQDDIIDPLDTKALADRWCALDVEVDSRVTPGGMHNVMTADPFVTWTADRLLGVPLTTTC